MRYAHENRLPGKARQGLVELTTLKDIQTALGGGIVFCDLAQPSVRKIPVRDVRRFNERKLDKTNTITTEEWTSLAFQGKAKGYEVLTLEGWHVPEKVYTL